MADPTPKTAPADETLRRKDSHLDLCAKEDVEPLHGGTLLDQVQLVHDALPDLSEDDLDLSTPFLGKTLRAPILITGITGGTPRGAEVNRALAATAERFGVAFGVGSQRAMLERPEAAETFAVREVAPTIPLLGNIGLGQVVSLGIDRARYLIDAIGADGLAVHLNVAQELAQREGDRDFRGGTQAITRLAEALGPRLLVKETGCGIGPAVCQRLVDAGVRTLDVSGAGGTSWVKVELLRRGWPGAEPFAPWGIPTAAAILGARRRVGGRAKLIASGGIRDGLQAAKALALGADVVGFALPIFRASQQGDPAAALEAILGGLRMAMLLTGCRTVAELRDRPKVIGGALKDWMEAFER